MLLFRAAVLLLLLLAAVSFALFVGTGESRYKQFGLRTLKWTLLAGACFFAVLILERIA
jgi:fucose 4-O-acetylase-like acetyltransferase